MAFAPPWPHCATPLHPSIVFNILILFFYSVTFSSILSVSCFFFCAKARWLVWQSSSSWVSVVQSGAEIPYSTAYRYSVLPVDGAHGRHPYLFFFFPFSQITGNNKRKKEERKKERANCFPLTPFCHQTKRLLTSSTSKILNTTRPL